MIGNSSINIHNNSSNISSRHASWFLKRESYNPLMRLILRLLYKGHYCNQRRKSAVSWSMMLLCIVLEFVYLASIQGMLTKNLISGKLSNNRWDPLFITARRPITATGETHTRTGIHILFESWSSIPRGSIMHWSSCSVLSYTF